MPLMDKDFTVACQFVRHRMPHIRFLFIGPRLCSTLLSDPASRRRPGASLSLLLHQDVKRTFTSKMLNNARHTRNKPSRPREGFLRVRSCKGKPIRTMFFFWVDIRPMQVNT